MPHPSFAAHTPPPGSDQWQTLEAHARAVSELGATDSGDDEAGPGHRKGERDPCPPSA